MERQCARCGKTFIISDKVVEYGGKRFVFKGKNFKNCCFCRNDAARKISNYKRICYNNELNDYPMHLDKTLRDIDLYNRAHGTNHSYGQYVGLRDVFGWFKR